MRRILFSLTSLVFVALGSLAAAQPIPNVPDTARYISYSVTSATTNFDVPFAMYGDCTDLTVKVASVVQTSGFTCISKSGNPLGSIAQPITDAQVQFTTAVSNANVEIIGNRHPRFSMVQNKPGITREEFNRSLGTIISRQRESYDRLLPLGASIMAGFGLPSSSIGTSGSYYDDLTTGNVYGPKSSTWPANPAFSPSVFTPLNPNLAFVTGAAGVICDGTTDANAGGALQAVINNAATAKRRLFWPPAVDCHLKTAINVPSNTDWEGFGTTISFDPNITLGNPISGTPLAMTLQNISNVRWRGLIFNGPGAATLNSGTRIVGAGITDVTIVESTFQNFGKQQAFTGTLTNGSGTITSVSSVAGLVVGMNVNLNNAVIGTITAIGTNTVTMAPAATTSGSSSLIANFYAQGFASFTPNNVRVERSLFQNNSGDGLGFSNNVRGTRILNNQFINNQDSAFVLCTIGGSDNQAIGNTVSAPLGITNPPIVSERCQNSVISYNSINSGAGSAAIRIARYGDTADINQDVKVIGNTVTGGGFISVEDSGTTQGSQSVPKGGLFKVIGNNVISPSGAGINIVNSTNGAIIGNAVTGAGGEGILENAATGGVSTGNNIISGNIIDGATYCLRQFSSPGTIIKSQYTGNDERNCSVTARQFVSADYYDQGNISGTFAGIVPIVNGGTNASTAATARSNLGAAASGANGDITSITGLTTPLPVAEGGSGSGTAAGARSNLGAAASGANGDITSLTGLTTPLPLTEGGTGSGTAAGARTNLGVTATGGDTTYAFRSNNLSDLANTATARGNIGAAASATTVTPSGSITGGGDLSANRTLAYAGDGSASTFSYPTMTVTTSGTLPTTFTAVMRYKQIATKYYTANLAWNISTVGSPTSGTVAFLLPNSAVGTVTSRCSNVFNVSLGTDVANSYAYIDTTGKLQVNFGSAPLQNNYSVACGLFEVN